MSTSAVNAAWEMTRQISPRRLVRAADSLHDGSEILNTYSRIHPVAGNVPRVPWAVHLTDQQHKFRLLLVDFDAKGQPSRAAQDSADLTHLLDQVGIGYVECASSGSRDGGRHVWIALAEPAEPSTIRYLARLLKLAYASCDPTPLLNPTTGAGRPPGAPHRRGGASRVLRGDLNVLRNPITSLTDLATLQKRLRSENARTHTRATQTPVRRTPLGDGASIRLGGPRRALSPAIQQLVDAKPSPRADHSTIQWSILLGAARAGWSLAEVMRELLDRPGLEHSRTRRLGATIRVPRPTTGSNAPDAVVTRMWREAVKFVATHDALGGDPTFAARSEAISQVAEDLLERVDATPGRWASKSHVADRLVVEKVIELAVDAVKPEVEASIRTIAERIGVDRETTRCALNRLVEEGWVTRTKDTNGRRAAFYTIDPQGVFPILVQQFLSQADAPPTPERQTALQHLMRDRSQRTTSDIFAPRLGLGRELGLIYARLEDAPTPSSMALLLGVPEAKVREKFERLASHRLALPRPDGTWERRDLTPAAAVALATALGSDGYLERMKAQHVVERELWAWWCAELEWMRAPRAERARRGAGRAGSLQAALIPDRHDNVFGAHPRRGGRADYAAARRVVLRHHEFVEAA